MQAKKNRKRSKPIRSQIYRKFGWTLEWWAKSRGFSRWQMYDFLRGRAGQKTQNKILEALKRDGIEVENLFQWR